MDHSPFAHTRWSSRSALFEWVCYENSLSAVGGLATESLASGGKSMSSLVAK